MDFDECELELKRVNAKIGKQHKQFRICTISFGVGLLLTALGAVLPPLVPIGVLIVVFALISYSKPSEDLNDRLIIATHNYEIALEEKVKRESS